MQTPQAKSSAGHEHENVTLRAQGPQRCSHAFLGSGLMSAKVPDQKRQRASVDAVPEAGQQIQGDMAPEGL